MVRPAWVNALEVNLDGLRDAPTETLCDIQLGKCVGYASALFWTGVIDRQQFRCLELLAYNAASCRRRELASLRVEAIKSRPPVLPLPIVEEGGHVEWPQ